MSQITGTIQIASSDPSSPRVLNWRANKRYGNVEQTCQGGSVGDPVPANTYYADTQEAADALAQAALVCTPVASDFTEDFEGPGFENVWTTTAGSPDDQYATTPAPLVGSYSLFVSDTESDEILCETLTPNAGNTYAFFEIVTYETAGGEDTLNIGFQLRASNAPYGDLTGLLYAFIGANDRWIIDGSGATQGIGGNVVEGTRYYVWIDYVYATGAVEVRVATTGTRPVGTTVTGAWMASTQWDKLRIYASIGSAIIDHIIVSADAIGSNP